MNPAVCTAVNDVANVTMNPDTGEPTTTGRQTIVQLVSVNAGARTDITITNPPAALGTFEPGQVYDLACTPAPAAPPAPPASKP